MGRILNPLELDVEVDSEKVSDYLLRFPDMLEAVNQVIRTCVSICQRRNWNWSSTTILKSRMNIWYCMRGFPNTLQQ